MAEFEAAAAEIAAVGTIETPAVKADTAVTAAAATELLRNAGGLVTRAAFVIDLPELGGREKLAERSVDVSALMNFAGA